MKNREYLNFDWNIALRQGAGDWCVPKFAKYINMPKNWNSAFLLQREQFESRSIFFPLNICKKNKNTTTSSRPRTVEVPKTFSVSHQKVPFIFFPRVPVGRVLPKTFDCFVLWVLYMHQTSAKSVAVGLEEYFTRKQCFHLHEYNRCVHETSTKSKEVQFPCHSIEAWLIARRCSLEGAIHRLLTLRGIMILLHNSLAVEVMLLVAIWSRRCEKAPVVRLKLARSSPDQSAVRTSSCPDGVTLWSLAALLKLMSNYHVQTNRKRKRKKSHTRHTAGLCNRVNGSSCFAIRSYDLKHRQSNLWCEVQPESEDCTSIKPHQRQNKAATAIPAQVKKKKNNNKKTKQQKKVRRGRRNRESNYESSKTRKSEERHWWLSRREHSNNLANRRSLPLFSFPISSLPHGYSE